MFDWLGDIFSGIGNAIGDTIEYLGTQIANTIFDAILQWFYEIIYGAVADFFTMMGNMGAEIFDLSWVQATIRLFTLFGWSLFVAGTVVAMLINAQLRSKQEEIQPVRCDVACIVELSNAEFYDFQFNPLADHDFIKEHLPDLKTDEFHAIPCMLVLGEGVDDGILVDPQGYDYARYTAYIPMARQLFQSEQAESEDDTVDEDDLEEEPFQGMTM